MPVQVGMFFLSGLAAAPRLVAVHGTASVALCGIPGMYEHMWMYVCVYIYRDTYSYKHVTYSTYAYMYAYAYRCRWREMFVASCKSQICKSAGEGVGSLGMLGI